jgi:hypothetical protein
MITFNLEAGTELITITGFLRPPSKTEIDGYRRLVMLSMSKRNEKDVPDIELAKVGFAYQDELIELGEKMLYGVKGSVPEWAEESCKTAKDVVLQYCSAELFDAVNDLFAQKMGKAAQKQELEAAIEKN